MSGEGHQGTMDWGQADSGPVVNWIHRLHTRVFRKFHLTALTLFIAAIARYNAVSGLYLLLAGLSELVHSPWINNEGRLGLRGPHVAGLALASSALACVGHIAFQIYVTVSGDTGPLADECGTAAMFWAAIGFTRLDRGLFDILLGIVPDICVAGMAAVEVTLNARAARFGDVPEQYILATLLHEGQDPDGLANTASAMSGAGEANMMRQSSRPGGSQPKRSSGSDWTGRKQLAEAYLTASYIVAMFRTMWSNHGPQFLFVLLCTLAAVVQPSALSLPYAVIAAVSLLMWAFRLPATATSRALWVMVLIFAISHVAVIYLYQFPFAQHAAPHSSLAARMLGLFRIVVSGPGRTCPPINPPFAPANPYGIVQFLCASALISLTCARMPFNPDEVRASLDPSVQNTLLVKIVRRYNHVLFFCVLIGWSVTFHALLCLPLLVYGLAGFVLPVWLTAAPMPACTVYCALLWLSSVVWNIDTDAVLPSDPDIGMVRSAHATAMLAKMAFLLLLICFCKRYTSSWQDLRPGADTGASLFARYRRRRTTQVSLADQKGLLSESEDSDDDDQQPDTVVEVDDDGDGSGSASAAPRETRSKLELKWLRTLLLTLNSVSEYTYIVALVLLFLCILQQVNLFNAVYLIFFLVFIVSPGRAARYWGGLVIYCEFVILCIYMYYFSVLKDHIPVELAQVIGLAPQKGSPSLTHVLGWHLAILALAVIQWVFFRVVHVHKSNQERHMESTPDASASQADTLVGKISMVRIVLFQLALTCWVLICYVVLLAVSLVGGITLIKTAFLAFFFITLAIDQIFDESFEHIRRFWPVIPVFALFALFAMYFYQFDFVSEFLLQFLTARQLAQIGLSKASSLQEYLLGETLVIWTTVLQLKMFGVTYFDNAPEAAMNRSLEEQLTEMGLQKWVTYLRFLKRLTRIAAPMVGQLVLFSALLQNVEALNVATMALLVFFMARPFSHWIRCSLFIYLEVLLISKILFQLPLVSGRVPFSNEDLTWFGLGQESNVVWSNWDYFIAIFLFAFDRVAMKGLLPTTAGGITALPPDELFPMDESDDDDTFDPTSAKLLERMVDDDVIHRSLKTYIKYIGNNLLRLTGRQLCMIMTCATCFIRLNAVGMVYMLCLVVMLLGNRLLVRRLWFAFVIIIATLAVIQYMSLVYIPPSLHHKVPLPWDSWPYKLKLYCFLPPGQSAYQLFADFTLLMLCKYQLGAYAREAREAAEGQDPVELFTPYNFYKSPRPLTRKIELFIVYYWHVGVLIFAFMAGAIQTDIPSFGYVFYCFRYMFEGQALVYDAEKRRSYWRGLVRFNFAVLFLKMAWQLPALLIDWGRLPEWSYTLVNMFALTRGLTLHGDSRLAYLTPAWSTMSGGMLCDFLLFCLLQSAQLVLKSQVMEDVSTLAKNEMYLTTKRAIFVSSNIQKKLRQELITDVAAFQAASDRIRALNDKHHEALSNGDRTFLLFRDPADLYDVEEMPDVEPDAESETRPSNAIDRTASKPAAATLRQRSLRRLPPDSPSDQSDASDEVIKPELDSHSPPPGAEGSGDSSTVLVASGANRYKNAFDQLMHWNWDPAANENQAQAPAQPTAAPQSVPWHQSLLRIYQSLLGMVTSMLWDFVDYLEARSSGYALMVGGWGAIDPFADAEEDTEEKERPRRASAAPVAQPRDEPVPPPVSRGKSLLSARKPAAGAAQPADDDVTLALPPRGKSLLSARKPGALTTARPTHPADDDGSDLEGKAHSDTEAAQEVQRDPPKRKVSTHPGARLLRRFASMSKVTPLNPTSRFSKSDIKALKSDGVVIMDQLGNLHSVKSMPKLIRVRDTLGLPAAIWGSLFRFALSHTAELCYLGIVFNQLYYANVLSTVLPVSLFTWGIWIRPWPSAEYWTFVTLYLEAAMCVKYIFQLDCWSFNDPAQPHTAWWVPVIGIQKVTVGSFARSELVDLVLLLLLIGHRHVSQILATWDYSKLSAHMKTDTIDPKILSQAPSEGVRGPAGDNESDVRSDAGSVRSGATFESDDEYDISSGDDVAALHGQSKDSLVRTGVSTPLADDHLEGGEQPPASPPAAAAPWYTCFTTLFRALFRDAAVAPRDYYVYVMLADTACFCITAWYWSAFSNDSGSLTEYIEESRIPTSLLVVLMGQFGLLLFDRVVYLTRALELKVVLQVTVVIAVHVYAFYYLPLVLHTHTPGRSMRGPIILWYLSKAIYMYASGLQIRHGYPRYLLKNFFTKSYGAYNAMLFKAYRAVPFVFETLSVIDWTFTGTTLTLFEWWKLEEIFAHLFVNNCRYKGLLTETRRLGQRKAAYEKIIQGFLLLLGIILIIWAPLLIVSFSRVTSVPSPPDVVRMSLRINSEELWTISSNADDIAPVSDELFEQLGEYFSLEGYRAKDVYRVRLQTSSRRTWSVSPPSRLDLEYTAAHGTQAMPIELEVGMDKLVNGTQNLGGKISMEWAVGDPARGTFASVLNVEVLVQKSGKIKPVGTNVANLTLTLVTGLSPYPPEVKVEWWDVKQGNYLLPSDAPPAAGTVELYTVNEPQDLTALSKIAGMGIIGIYVSIVLVAGRFLRMAVTDMHFRIMYDDINNCDMLLALVNDIKMCREVGNLYLEEVLYRHLIEIYRDPQKILRWTNTRLAIKKWL